MNNWTTGNGSSGEFRIPVSEKEYFRHYLSGVGGLCVCILGILGNVISAVVLSRKTMKLPTYVYLFSIAICDVLACLFSMLILLQDTRNPGQAPPGEAFRTFGVYCIIYIQPIAVAMQVVSVWLTMAFTVDRYIFVCHPFAGERLCTRKRALIVVLCLYVFGIFYNMPRFFEHEVNIHSVGNWTGTFVGVTHFGQSNTFKQFFHLWLYIAFVCVVPFFTILVLNIFLITDIRKSRQYGREMGINDENSRRHRNDVNLMVVVVVTLFLVCQFPALVSHILWAAWTEEALVHTPSYFVLNEVANFLILINSAINFVPYITFGRMFRHEFLRVFCSRAGFGKGDIDERPLNHSANSAADKARTPSCSSNMAWRPPHVIETEVLILNGSHLYRDDPPDGQTEGEKQS